MEIRKLYKQGKSHVLVIPSKYLKSLGWTSNDKIAIYLLTDNKLSVEKIKELEQLPLI
jgi:antitoxin component of MazEF toxin-antitoxin module